MGWAKIPVLSTFEKARRREIYRKLGRLATRRPASEDLLPLDEVRRRLRLFEQSYRGIQAIPVAAIAGSADRSADFDREFLPRKFENRSRWRAVEQNFPLGDFPPIVVYKVGDLYFVVDGHHRVAVAKQRNVDYIDAEVTELISTISLPATADLREIIHAEQQQMFMDETGLDRARPEARIEFSRPTGYVELLELVKAYGYDLVRSRKQVVSKEDVAADWYDRVYLPAVSEIRTELGDELASTTDADLFLWVHQRRMSLVPERGGLSFTDATRAATRGNRRRG